MSNSPTYFIDETTVSTRESEVPLASFRNGANMCGSNAPAIGVANHGPTQTTNLEQQLPNWTLLDQFGNPRSPITSQYLGVNALGTGLEGNAGYPVQFISNAGQGNITPGGDAKLVDLAVGYEESGASFNSQSWETLPDDLNVGASVVWRSVDGNEGGIFIAVGQEGRVSRSIDAGVTWVALAQGAGGAQPATTDFLKIKCINGDNIWLIGGDAGYLLISTDSGATWTNLPDGLGLGYTSRVNDIAVDFHDSVVVAFNGNGIAVSENNGSTWQSVTDIKTGGDGIINSVGSAGNGVFVLASNDRYCSRSTDGGFSWLELPFNLDVDAPAAAIKPRAFASIGNFIVATLPGGGQPSYLAYSRDGGSSWDNIQTNSSATTGWIGADSVGNFIVASSLGEYTFAWEPDTLTILPQYLNQLGSVTWRGVAGIANGVFVVVGNTGVSRSPTFS